jgi:hypothetical protein
VRYSARRETFISEFIGKKNIIIGYLQWLALIIAIARRLVPTSIVGVNKKNSKIRCNNETTI